MEHERQLGDDKQIIEMEQRCDSRIQESKLHVKPGDHEGDKTRCQDPGGYPVNCRH